MRRWIVLCLLLALPGCFAWTAPTHALVNEATAANRYTANGSTTVFAYSWKVYLNTDIEVLVDGTVKTLGTQYTVDGLGVSGGGNITFITAPLTGEIVTILRKQPSAQSSHYVPNEAFPSARIEKDLDKLVMQVQQLKEETDRALKFAKSSALVDQSVDAPTVGSFARGKTGGGIDWATPTNAGTLSSPVAISDGGTGATSAAAALTSLGALAKAGGTLTGVISSNVACATGYTRVSTTFCLATVPITVVNTPATSCTGRVLDADLPTNKLALIRAQWNTKANNGAASRSGTTNVYGSSDTCPTITATLDSVVYEQAAVAAGTVIDSRSTTFVALTLGGTLYTIDSNTGGNGNTYIASYAVLGYWDN